MRNEVLNTIFDEVRFMKLNPAWKPYTHGEHEYGRKNHHTDVFQAEIGPNLYAVWSICPECGVVRTKKIVGYGKDELGYATAFINQFISDGRAA